MTDRGEAMRRPPRAPMPRRTRRRWAVVAAVATCWAAALAMTGSVVSGTVLLLMAAALGTACLLALRAMGVGAAHPWVQGVRSRPWRDGQDVLQLGLRHLPDVFVITPGGSLLAPNSVELWLNPRDFISLCELMDIDLVNASASEVYQEQVAAHGARLARPGGLRCGSSAIPRSRRAVTGCGRPVRWTPRRPRRRFRISSRFRNLQLVPGRATGAVQAPRRRLALRPRRPARIGPRPPSSPASRRSPSAAITRSRCCAWSRAAPRRRRSCQVPAPGRGDVELPLPEVPDGFPGACPVHLRRRPVVGHQPGPQRAGLERCRGGGAAPGPRRRRDPLGDQGGLAGVPGRGRLTALPVAALYHAERAGQVPPQGSGC